MKILSAAGYKSVAVANGQEAVDAVIHGDFDVILMDIQMPEVDGYKATEQIRALHDSKNNIPIIALTAHALIGDREKCIKTGMTDYVSKPIIGQDLIKKIDDLLNIKNGNSSQPVKVPTTENLLLDLNRLKKVSLGDIEFEKDLLGSYVIDLDLKFKSLNELVDRKELDKIIELAHTIKGASYSIGAAKIGDEAYGIELSGKNNDWLNIIERMENLRTLVESTKAEIKNYLEKK